jgi:hypothetical protein
MKITDSSVAMAAASHLESSTTKQAHLEYWVGDRSGGTARRLPGAPTDKAEITALARRLAAKAAIAEPPSRVENFGVSDSCELGGLSERDKQRVRVLEDFLYRLTGRHFKFLHLKLNSAQEAGDASPAPGQAAPQPARAGYGVIFDYSETHSEKQSMTFSSTGVVKTADGRTIDFNVALSMSREFQSSVELHLRAGDAKVDPLVINFGGAPQLSAQKDFVFDIDNDGDADQISRLLAGSGFLALDRNGDGEINDGGELFGPGSGDGFLELSGYDADGNGWIDENDPVFDGLRIWMADEQGNMQLFALGQKGVGALYLGNVSSALDINGAQNESLASVQSTGVYLNENGTAGTIQHIDFAV